MLTERGHDVTTMYASDASTVDVEDFDAVMVGSSVNGRRHWPAVIEFVRRNRDQLAGRPSAFFQVSLASIIPMRWAQEGAEERAGDLFEATGWRPDRVGLFAGAVKYTQYDRPTRWLFELVSTVTTGDTDTSRDYEYTDWEAVERFAVEFAEFAEYADARQAETSRIRGVAGLGLGKLAAIGIVGVGLAVAVYRLFASQRRPHTAPTDDPASRPPADDGDQIEA